MPSGAFGAGPDAAATLTSGPGCAAVPTEGEGSFEGMADDPAATAAGNNPQLSTLAAAVDAAGLTDTLNGEGPFTIFAPSNSAFAKIPADDLEAVLADPAGVAHRRPHAARRGRPAAVDDATSSTPAPSTRSAAR